MSDSAHIHPVHLSSHDSGFKTEIVFSGFNWTNLSRCSDTYKVLTIEGNSTLQPLSDTPHVINPMDLKSIDPDFTIQGSV